MQRLISKLQILTTPLVDGEELDNVEIVASSRLMEWMSDAIDALLKNRSQELKSYRRIWPNYLAWSNFIHCLPEHMTTTDNDNEKHYQFVVDYNKQLDTLISEAEMMLHQSPGASQPSKVKGALFLPFSSQREIYRDAVLSYYHHFIENRDIPHKDLMVYYAALYQAIAVRNGIDKIDFLGHEFDSFLYDYCGIKYNRSSSPRGRYRQVADVRTSCLSKNCDNQSSLHHHQLFFRCLKDLCDYLPPMSVIPGAFVGVPQN